jgi:leucyl/phenylalanyl-tRNA--protein transferase
MSIVRLGSELVFPSPDEAEPGGLLAMGGDLSPERLLLAYSQGIFPWYEEGLPILWHSPDPRMVLRPGELRVTRSLRKRMRQAPFTLRLDTAFEQVVRACASVPRPGQHGTWITGDMIEAYVRLHEQGFAHSAEAWVDTELVGGLYGVSLGSGFFGESMFAARRDASKIAFVALVRQLERWGFELVDCQIHTPHLARFGATEWPRSRFLADLARAVEKDTRRGPWRFDARGSDEGDEP